MRPVVVTAVLLVLCTLDSATAGVCPLSCNDYPDKPCGNGWSRIDAKRCAKFFMEYKDYLAAKRFCRDQGGNLVSIHNLDEMINVVCLAARAAKQVRHKFWIGAQVMGRNHKFGWNDGTEFKYTRWHRGEPSNYQGREYCVESNFIDWGYWNDASCQEWQYFMCAKNM